MKPSFALDLSAEGVTLLRRTARGWMDIGHAAFTDPDFPAALEYLRSTAMGMSPKGLFTKLVIPNSQILYSEIEAPGPSEEERRSQIAVALEGRTPYAVEDLAFDWHGDGPVVNVAVVAKETLDEAESFATEHRFNPVAFVARPETDFGTEPYFGTTSAAESVLPKRQTVERDTEVMRIISREIPKSAEGTTAPAQPQQAPEPDQVSDAPDLEVSEPAPDMAPQAADQSPPPEPPPPEPPAPEPPATEPPATEPTVPPEAPAKPQEATFSAQVAEAGAPGPDVPEQAAKSIADVPEAPIALDVAQEDSAPAHVPPAPRAAAAPSVLEEVPASENDDLPPPPSAAARMAFASRRSADTADAGEIPARPVVPKPAIPEPLQRPASSRTVERPPGVKPPPKFSYDDPVPSPPRMPGDPPLAPVVQKTKPAKPAETPAPVITAPGIPGMKSKKPAPPRLTKSIAPAEGSTAGVSPDALARGLGARTMAQRGKPRYLGLILTAILLIFLAIVAAWSSLVLTQNGADDTSVDLAALTPPAPEPAEAEITAPAAVETDLPSIEDEASADGELALPEDGLVDDEAMAADAVLTGQIPADEPSAASEPADPVADAPAPVPVPEPAPQTGLDSTEVAAAQPRSQDQDEIFLAGMDTPPALTDPLSLPVPSSGADALPGPQMPPPPFGTVYRFDAEGRIVPTPEGIMTPDGVLLIAGQPPLTPPVRPDSVVSAALQTAPEAAATADAGVTTAIAGALPDPATAPLTPTETFAADPSLAEARPRLRPETLNPAASGASDEDASFAPAEGSRFASLRPRLRPQSVLAAGEASRRAVEAASLAAQAAAEAAVASANADGSISPMAVSVSRVPAPRPRNLDRAVAAAVAAATQPDRRPTASTAQPQKPAEDEGDDEPEVASAAPRIPTRANVAKQATYVNAINLSKLNLIGVYGTQSKRYALVRQANGRYTKVRVGDRLDGGTVQAITASEVRYQKGGRLVSLALPKG